MYFGFQDVAENGKTVPGSLTDLLGAGAPGVTNSYNFPGGASGAIESADFSLAGIAPADLPTLYFTYQFDTDNLPLTDALRVYASGENGQWILVATNSTSSSSVQPLFANTSNWRQARVPLDQFAVSQMFV